MVNMTDLWAGEELIGVEVCIIHLGERTEHEDIK